MQVRRRNPIGHQFIDMTGRQCGYWQVLYFAGFAKRYAVWKCKCTCGTKGLVRGSHLRSGKSLSCGCVNRAAMGRSTSREFGTWSRLPKNMLCRRWRSFAGFIADMGRQPTGYYLVPSVGARILSKRTCEWAAYKRPPIGSIAYVLGANGTAKTAKQIAADLGISRQSLYQRLAKKKVANGAGAKRPVSNPK